MQLKASILHLTDFVSNGKRAMLDKYNSLPKNIAYDPIFANYLINNKHNDIKNINEQFDNQIKTLEDAFLQYYNKLYTTKLSEDNKEYIDILNQNIEETNKEIKATNIKKSIVHHMSMIWKYNMEIEEKHKSILELRLKYNKMRENEDV